MGGRGQREGEGGRKVYSAKINLEKMNSTLNQLVH